MKNQVLILSSNYDFSTDLVCVKLKELGANYIRINKEQLKDYRLSLDPINQSLKVHGPSVNVEVTPDLGSVYFRQPIFLRNTPSTSLSPKEQLERSQWNAFMRSLSVFDQAAWMNYPKSTYLAECKPFQLLEAKRSGFKVPFTIVGNDIVSVKQYFENDAIVKSLDTVLLREGQDCLFTYTSISDISILNDDNLYSAPLLVQRPLKNKIDIRVTCIGKDLSAVKIMCHGKGIEGDWRICPKETLEYKDYVLPNEIEVSCKNLMKSLSLSFGAIDLIESNDEIYFIEINPTGEWGWITNEHRKFDIKIARWLFSPPGKNE